MKFIARIFLPRLSPSGLAIIVNLPLILSGLPLTSFDAYFHIFFADHYRRQWFDLTEAKWFGGFSMASYPPLVHQLIAVASAPASAVASLWGGTPNEIRYRGEVAGYYLILLATLACLPLAVERFAEIFVPRRAARTAGWLAVGLPSVYLTAYSFGQLPTLAAAAALMWALAETWQFTRTGRLRCLASAVAWAGVTAAIHHAVLIFAVLAGMGMLGQVAGQRAAVGARPTARRRLMQLTRLILCGLGAGVFGAIVIWPFIAWSRGYAQQTPIDHFSRHNLITDPLAGYYFLWPMYGPLLLAWPVMAGWVLSRIRRPGPDRQWRFRYWPLLALTLILFSLGLGGTTPLPALLFGPDWAWLTYDRFSFWAGLALLPSAGLAWHVYRGWVGRRILVGLLGLFSLFGACAAVWAGAQPQPLALERIVDFLNTTTSNGDRYLTLGFGDQLARLSVLTDARTIDGMYYTARAVPELRSSGLGTLDGAQWNPAGAAAVIPFLQRGQAWGIRWVFNAHQVYVKPLEAAGWQLRGIIAPGVELWRNPAPWVSADWQMPVESDPQAAAWWGIVPLATFGLAAGWELDRRLAGSRLAATLALLLAAWPFFYRQTLWTRAYDFVYYTYTSAVVYLADVLTLAVVGGVARVVLAQRFKRAYGHEKSLSFIRDVMPRSLVWMAALVLVFVILSIPASTDPVLSLGFALHLCAITLAAVAVTWVTVDLDWRWVAGALTLGLILQTVVGVVESAVQNTAWLAPLSLPWPGELYAATRGASVVSPTEALRWLRAYGTLPHPNTLGAYLVVTEAGPLMGYLRTGKARWLWPLFGGGAVLLLTFSRAAWLAALVMILFAGLVVPAEYRRRALLASIGLGLVFVSLAVALRPLVGVRATGDSASPREAESTADRLKLAQMALDLYRQRPLTGVGAGAFAPTLAVGGALFVDPVHSVPLLVLAETGLGGGAAVLGFGLAILRLAWRQRGRDLNSAILSSAMVGLLVTALFDHFLWSQSTGRLWFAIAGGLWLGALKVAMGVDHAQLARPPIEVAVETGRQRAKNERQAGQDGK